MTQPADGERLREAWRALADEAGGAPEVDDEAVWRAAGAESSVDERNAVVDAVARDPATAESWRLAQELRRELARREPKERLAPRRDPVARRWHRWAALAAMLVLALGLSLWRLVGPPDTRTDGDMFRDSDSIELASRVPEDVAQPRDEVTLSWSEAGDGTRYTLRVLTSDLEPLTVLRELESTSVRLPAERFAGIAEGERLLWQVEARLPDGQTVSSPTFFLDLAPASEGSTPPEETQPQEP